MKRFTFFYLLLSVLIFQQLSAKKDCLIAEEINHILEHDDVIKYRWNMKNDELKGFLYSIDTAPIVARETSLIGKGLDRFFYGGIAGTLLRQQLKDLIFLPDKKAPRVNQMVKQLAEKAGIDVPPVFLAGDKELFNAAATSFSHGRSMVILGKKLVDSMTDEELRGVLAHELGHVKYYHVPKNLVISMTLLVAQLYLLYKLASIVSKSSDGIGTYEDKNGKQYIIRNTLSSHCALTMLGPDLSPVSHSSMLMTWLVMQAGLIGMGVLTTWVISMISRSNERQADDESMRIAGPRAFLAAMQAIKSYSEGEMNRFDQEYEFCKKQLAELEKTFPDTAASITQGLEKFSEMTHDAYLQHLDEDSGSHPAINNRIKRGELAIRQEY